MLQLSLQLVTLLFVIALITLFMFDMRRRRRERKEFYKRVSEKTKRQVDRLSTSAGVEEEDGTTNGDREVSFEVFEATAQKLFARVDNALQAIENQRRQDVVQTSEQAGRFQNLLDNLSRRQTALQELVDSSRSAKTAEATQSTEPMTWRVSTDMIEASPPIDGLGSAPSTSTQVTSDSQSRFEALSTWLRANMQNVVQRSLSARSQPETFTINAPSELRPTAQIADGLVVLIGTSGHAEKLALVLPGSYIGARYYNWFEIPKGTNERVEDTVEPAVVSEVAGEFVVVKRGVVRQS